jgi:hypothetical protein
MVIMKGAPRDDRRCPIVECRNKNGDWKLGFCAQHAQHYLSLFPGLCSLSTVE